MTGLPVAAYVALGSNLHEPVLQVRAALRLLDDLPQTRLVRQSALYRSAPLGKPRVQEPPSGCVQGLADHRVPKPHREPVGYEQPAPAGVARRR